MKKTIIGVLVLMMAVRGGCGMLKSQQQPEQRSGTLFAMDTVMDITIYDGSEQVLTQMKQRLLALDQLWSTTQEQSDIAMLNQHGQGSLAQETQQLLLEALALCEKTQGALDISIYPVVKAWGFTTGKYQVPSQQQLEAYMAKVNYNHVVVQQGQGQLLQQGMEIDLGSVAKGYAGDLLCQLAKQEGVTSAIISLGGNIQTIGKKPDGSLWNVAIQDPVYDGYVGVLSVGEKAVVTSGLYERYFVDEQGKRYGHIIHSRTGMPVDNVLQSVTIVGDQGIYCDGLSTAIFVMGLEQAVAFWQQYQDFEMILVTQEQQIYITPGLIQQFQPMGSYTAKDVVVISNE